MSPKTSLVKYLSISIKILFKYLYANTYFKYFWTKLLIMDSILNNLYKYMYLFKTNYLLIFNFNFSILNYINKKMLKKYGWFDL